MTIISDATSLILLAKAELLELFVNRNKVIVPKLVYGEVAKGKDKGRADSMLVEKLVNEKKLSIVTAHKARKNKIEKAFNLRGGELEVISFALGKNDVILTDDKKCLNAAKALNMNFINSLDVTIALHKNGAISKEKAMECVDILEEYGWYAKDMIKRYREVLK